MKVLNAKAVRTARENAGLTQEQLSEATKPQIVVSTISRIERGKSSRVHDRTAANLARALGVELRLLCAATEPDAEMMKVRVATYARNALALVSKRYRVSEEHIIDVAPLLFYLAAEQSLRARSKRLQEVEDAVEASESLRRSMAYMPLSFDIDVDVRNAEATSIERRDIFATYGTNIEDQDFPGWSDWVSDYNEGTDNPFAAFLTFVLAQVDSPSRPVHAVDWAPSEWPTYVICSEEAAALVGNDPVATQAIIHGGAALDQMPDGTPGDRAAWARAEAEREAARLSELLDSWEPDEDLRQTWAPR